MHFAPLVEAFEIRAYSANPGPKGYAVGLFDKSGIPVATLASNMDERVATIVAKALKEARGN